MSKHAEGWETIGSGVTMSWSRSMFYDPLMETWLDVEPEARKVAEAEPRMKFRIDIAKWLIRRCPFPASSILARIWE